MGLFKRLDVVGLKKFADGGTIEVEHLRTIEQSVAHLVQTQHFAIQALPASIDPALMPQHGNPRTARSDNLRTHLARCEFRQRLKRVPDLFPTGCDLPLRRTKMACLKRFRPPERSLRMADTFQTFVVPSIDSRKRF